MELAPSITAGARSRDGRAFEAGTLASRVAEKLLKKIGVEELAPGTRLPSEQAMARHFGVSRTVIREAIALLKADDLLETRKGSGTFIRQPEVGQLPRWERLPADSVQSLLNLIEIRRAIEAEMAALAALRRTPAQLVEIDYALRRIERAVSTGSDAVEEDVQFHRCIAAATGNSYWMRFLEIYSLEIHSVVKATRGIEARQAEYAIKDRAEHEKIASAIASGDVELARAAAAEHMEQCAKRVREADHDFWLGEGGG